MVDLVELILKRRDGLERSTSATCRRPRRPRNLAIPLVGFAASMSLVFTSASLRPRLDYIDESGLRSEQASPSRSTCAQAQVDPWMDGSAPTMIAAYAIGLIAATGICLPSLYFDGLLAGVTDDDADVGFSPSRQRPRPRLPWLAFCRSMCAWFGMLIFNVPEGLKSLTFWLGLAALYRRFVRNAFAVRAGSFRRQHDAPNVAGRLAVLFATARAFVVRLLHGHHACHDDTLWYALSTH